MYKVLIMGGTGAMGRHLSDLLAGDDSFQVYVTSRSDRLSKNSNLFYLKGNAKDIGWIKKIIGDVRFDAIFDFMLYNGDEFLERCSLYLANCDQYFYLSSSRALGDYNGVITEDLPNKFDALKKNPEFVIDSYGMRKARDESFLRNSDSRNFTIVRPSMSFSTNRFQFFSGDNFDVIRACKKVPTLIPKEAINRFTNITYGKNVAKMLKGLIGNGKALGETFNVVTKSLMWGEIAEIYKNVFGLEYKLISFPEYLDVLGIEYSRSFDRFRHRNISNKKVLDVTGLSDEDFGSLEDNLREAWASSNQENYKNSTGSIFSMAKFDWATNSIINLNGFPNETKIDYLSSLNEISNRVKLGGFWVRPNEKYWSVSQFSSDEDVLVFRNEKKVDDYGWLNFRNFNFFLKLDVNSYYSMNIEIFSESLFDFRPFFHLFGKNIMRVDGVKVHPGFNNIILKFKPRDGVYSDFAITATEVPNKIKFTIKKILIQKFNI